MAKNVVVEPSPAVVRFDRRADLESAVVIRFRALGPIGLRRFERRTDLELAAFAAEVPIGVGRLGRRGLRDTELAKLAAFADEMPIELRRLGGRALDSHGILHATG
jgi:hypothetical protein